MEAETIEDYAFHGNIMELDYHSHITDSDMVSPDTLQTGHYDYDQVMVAFENDPRHQPHEQLEIEMLDDYPSNDSDKSLMTCPPSSSSSLVSLPATSDALSSYPAYSASPQASLVTFATFEPTQHKSPAHLDPGSLPPPFAQPTEVSPHQHPDAQPQIDSSHSSDVQYPGDPASSHPSAPSPSKENHQTLPNVDLPSTSESTESDHAYSPHTQPAPDSQSGNPEADIDGSEGQKLFSQTPLPVPVADPALPDTPVSPFPSSATSNQNQILETEQVPPTDEEVNGLCENGGSVPDEENASGVVSELLEFATEASGAQTVWENNPSAEDMPYEDYEPESRPRVRTDLLECVRVQLGSVNLNEEGLPIESEIESTSAPGVRLVCEGCEYSLFQKIEPAEPEKLEHSPLDDETVLLSEPEYRDLYFGPLEGFIQSLHNIFPNLHDDNKNEIVLNFPALEFKVPEDNVYTKELSLYDVDRLHIGARLPDRLLISLEKQPRLVHRFNVLATYVSGLAQSDEDLDANSGEPLTRQESDRSIKDSTTENEVGLNDDQPDVSELPGFVEGSPAPPVSFDEHDVTHSSIHKTESPSVGVDVTSESPELPSSATRPACDSLLPPRSSSVPPCGSQTDDLAGAPPRTGQVDLASDSTLSDLPNSDVTASSLHIGASSDVPSIGTSSCPHQPQKISSSNEHPYTTGEHANDVEGNDSSSNGGIVSAPLNPDQVVQFSPATKTFTKSLDHPGAQSEEAIEDGRASSPSELTIQGEDHVSEGEIEEFVDVNLPVCAEDHPASFLPEPSVSSHDAVTVHDMVKDTRISIPAVQTSVGDHDQEPLPNVSPRLPTCFKRTHEEVEFNSESDPNLDESELASDCLVDAKKPRVL